MTTCSPRWHLLNAPRILPGLKKMFRKKSPLRLRQYREIYLQLVESLQGLYAQAVEGRSA